MQHSPSKAGSGQSLTYVVVDDLKALVLRYGLHHVHVICVGDAEVSPPQLGDLLACRVPQAFQVDYRFR